MNFHLLNLRHVPLFGLALSMFFTCTQRTEKGGRHLIDGSPIAAAIARFDSLPAEKATEMARTISPVALRDSFFLGIIEKAEYRRDMPDLKAKVAAYKALSGGRAFSDAWVLYYEAEIDFLEARLPLASEKVQDALRMSKSVGSDDLTLLCYQLWTTALNNEGKIYESIEVTYQALFLAEKMGDPQAVADLNQKMGIASNLTGNSKKAIEFSQNALKYYEQTGDSIFQGMCYQALSVAFFRERDTVAAFRDAEKAIALFKMAHADADLVSAYQNLSRLCIQSGDFGRALRSTEAALEFHAQNPVAFWEPSLLLNRGICLFKMGQKAAAAPILEKAAELASRTGQRRIRLEAGQAMAALQAGDGNFRAGLETLTACTVLKDSLFSTEKQQLIADLGTKYETAKKDLQIVAIGQDKRIAEQRMAILALSLFAVLASGLSLLARQRGKQRQAESHNRFLEQEKELLAARAVLQTQLLRQAEAELQQKSDELDESEKNLLLKNRLIEELELRIQNQTPALTDEVPPGAGSRQANLMDKTAFPQLKILTEDDWQTFLLRINETFPNLLHDLKRRQPGLTPAELRLFLLLKLDFGNREVANVLGISVDSVWRSRHRLRKKLGLGEEVDFDGFVQGFR